MFVETFFGREFCYIHIIKQNSAAYIELCDNVFADFSTQAHWKYMSLHTFLQQRNYVPCSTFRGSFKVKCPESGAKTHV